MPNRRVTSRPALSVAPRRKTKSLRAIRITAYSTSRLVSASSTSAAVAAPLLARSLDASAVRGLRSGSTRVPLLAVARELAKEKGLGDRVEFREGDALRLPFPAHSFDAAVCATVLSHVPRGEAAIPELVRVLRSGGRLGVFDLDTDMTAFTHPDRTLTRRIVAAASDATAVDGWLVRRLPLLFQRAGLVDIRARGFFPLQTDLASFYANMADRCAEVAIKAGVVTEFEGRAWLDAFHEQGRQGPVLAGRLHIFVWGRRPALPAAERRRSAARGKPRRRGDPRPSGGYAG